MSRTDLPQNHYPRHDPGLFIHIRILDWVSLNDPKKNIFYRFPKISQWDLFNKQNIFSKSHISDDQGNHLPNTTTRPKDELIAMPIGAPGAGVAKDPASNIETGPQFS